MSERQPPNDFALRLCDYLHHKASPHFEMVSNMVYGLSDKGTDLLSDRLGMDRGKIFWREKNKEVKERYIQHTLMISNFRACLTLAMRAIPDGELLFWVRENPQELKDYVYFKEAGRQRRLSTRTSPGSCRL